MSTKINGQDFLKEVAKENELSFAKTKEVYDSIVNGIREEIKKGNNVVFSGFGNFYPLEVKERTVVLNGEERKIKAQRTMKFSTSKSFNNKVNE